MKEKNPGLLAAISIELICNICIKIMRYRGRVCVCVWVCCLCKSAGWAYVIRHIFNYNACKSNEVHSKQQTNLYGTGNRNLSKRVMRLQRIRHDITIAPTYYTFTIAISNIMRLSEFIIWPEMKYYMPFIQIIFTFSGICLRLCKTHRCNLWFWLVYEHGQSLSLFLL